MAILDIPPIGGVCGRLPVHSAVGWLLHVCGHGMTSGDGHAMAGSGLRGAHQRRRGGIVTARLGVRSLQAKPLINPLAVKELAFGQARRAILGPLRCSRGSLCSRRSPGIDRVGNRRAVVARRGVHASPKVERRRHAIRRATVERHGQRWAGWVCDDTTEVWRHPSQRCRRR